MRTTIMNEKYLKYAADEKYIIAATIILLLISGLLYFGYSSTKKERILLENKNNILENWTEDESMVRHEEFFKNLYSFDNDLLGEIENSGVSIKEIHEEQNGKTTLICEGSYRQITNTFGIIRKSKNLSIPSLKKITRKGATTEFQLEILTPQMR